MTSQPGNKRSIVAATALAAMLVPVVLTLVIFSIPSESADQSLAEPEDYPTVSVVTVSPDRHQATITGHGEATARYQVTLTAQLQGQVKAIVKGESGHQVLADEALLTIDDKAYQQALAMARLEVARAEVALLQEQREARQVKEEWQQARLDGLPDSPLVLREPQLKVAQLGLAQAKAQLAVARQDLNNTRIIAPFNGVVTERHVSPGSYVQQGDAVVSLYSVDQVEVRLFLSEAQWQLLPPEHELIEARWPVKLTGAHSAAEWQGRVSRVESHLDKTHRQRALVVTVEQPLAQTPPLFPGTFLQASLTGLELRDVLKLPVSALTREGTIWYLDEQQRLQRRSVTPLFQQQGAIFIKALDGLSHWRVLTHPLKNYLPNTRVEPQESDV